jgi:hypothetical protein
MIPLSRTFAVLCLTVISVSDVAAAEAILFNRDVRPILAENCFPCHGPDSASRKAGLRLDQRESAVKHGAMVPGRPDESELISRVFADDPADRMPPPASHKTLSSSQKELLRQWIASGAEYQPHWSLIAPVRPQAPAVKNPGWVKNPVDTFVLAAIERRGLQPAPEADRRTLARRLSLDLTGLPPTPAEVEALVNDPSPAACENLVDRLLASKHWGEHRARYWLDAARYADTHGIHFDNYREMWSYRDWVIGAFNRNLPFDRFTIEQLSGDLLPEPTLEQRVATGFNRCNITTNEGGVIPEEYLVLYTRDRTETTARVWLGLTAGCAVCHDHKFDPLSQKEFYQMSALFNNTTQGAMDDNIKDTPPTVFVPAAADRDRWPALVKELADARRQVEQRKKTARADFDKWLAVPAADVPAKSVPSEGLRLHAPLSDGKGDATQVAVDGKPRTVKLAEGIAWRPGQVAAQALACRAAAAVEIAGAGGFERDQAFSFGAWMRLSEKGLSGAVFARMDDRNAFRGWDLWLENGRPGAHIIHKWPDDALKVVASAAVKPNEWHHLFVTYDGSRQAGGVKIYIDGQPQQTAVQANSLKNTIRNEVPLKIAQRHTSSRVEDLVLQDVRLYGRALPGNEVLQLVRATRAVWLAAKPAGGRTDAERNELFDWWLPELDKPYRDATARARALEQEQTAVQSRGTAAHVMQERSEPAKAFVLYRGEYDKRREQVSAGTPALLPPMPAPASWTRSDRGSVVLIRYHLDEHVDRAVAQGLRRRGIAYCHPKRRSIGQIVLDVTLLWRVATAEEMQGGVEYL